MDLYNGALGQEEVPEPMELTLEQYEEGVKHYTSIIERADAARRLASNPDFMSLVLDGYLKNEPLRLADLMGSGRLNEVTFQNCANDIRAVGSFREYMKNIMEQGSYATAELEALEEARDIAIQEEEAAAAQ